MKIIKSHGSILLSAFFIVLSGYVTIAESAISTTVDWHPSGSKIAIGYDSGQIEIVDGSASRVLQTFKAEGWVKQLKWGSSDEQLLGASYSQDIGGSLWILDTSTGIFTTVIAESFGISDFDWNVTGDKLASIELTIIDAQNVSRVWQITSGSIQSDQLLDNQLFSIVDWNPANERYIALGDKNGAVSIWDIQENALTQSMSASLSNDFDLLVDLSWNFAGDRLITASYIGNIQLWKWDGSQLTLCFTFPNDLTYIGIKQVL